MVENENHLEKDPLAQLKSAFASVNNNEEQDCLSIFNESNGMGLTVEVSETKGLVKDPHPRRVIKITKQETETITYRPYNNKGLGEEYTRTCTRPLPLNRSHLQAAQILRERINSNGGENSQVVLKEITSTYNGPRHVYEIQLLPAKTLVSQLAKVSIQGAVD